MRLKTLLLTNLSLRVNHLGLKLIIGRLWQMLKVDWNLRWNIMRYICNVMRHIILYLISLNLIRILLNLMLMLLCSMEKLRMLNIVKLLSLTRLVVQKCMKGHLVYIGLIWWILLVFEKFILIDNKVFKTIVYL
jgi:hypothetical protein